MHDQDVRTIEAVYKARATEDPEATRMLDGIVEKVKTKAAMAYPSVESARQ